MNRNALNVLVALLLVAAVGSGAVFAQSQPEITLTVPEHALIGMDPATTNGGAAGTDRGVATELASALGDTLALASMAQGPQLSSSELADFMEGMDPATTNGGAAGTDRGVAARPALDTRLALALISMLQPPICVEDANSQPRPLWQELAPPGGSGYPNYIDVTDNLMILDSIKLLASIATRAAESLQDHSSAVEDPEAVGICFCSATEFHDGVVRKDCNVQTFPNCTVAGDYPLWLPTDLFKDTNNKFLFVLKIIEFLDAVKPILEKISGNNTDPNNHPCEALCLALKNLSSALDNLEELIAKYQKYIDQFTEGYHLGGYSTERPDLHLCVGYGGHGAFAQMLSLLGGEVKIGSRYASHNLSKKHRAQYRSGGFGVTAFGRTISILPGIEANLQIDGFKLWDVQKPFGIDFGPLNPGIPVDAIDKFDIFHLVDASDIDCTDNPPLNCNGSGLCCFDTGPNGIPDGYIQPGEFLIKGYYPASYKSGSNTYTWPRPAFNTFDWEKQNTAVFGAGLNLPLRIKPIEKFIPTQGIILYPGVTLFPKLTLKAGVEWMHKANDLRDRLKDAINKNLPDTLKLTADNFERPMHALQAPDVSADDTSSVFVQPGIAADLIIGIKLAKYLTLGIQATIGTSVKVEPKGHGGLHDLNVALTDALLNSNPSPDLPCDPIIAKKEIKRCSNELFLDEHGKPLSSGDYSCETTDPLRYHCKEPEQDRTCTPETAEQDCPKTKDCVAERGCGAYGYCTRGDMVEYDTTLAACEGEKVCQPPAVNAGKGCVQNSDCPGEKMCVGGTNQGKGCQTDREDCPGGVCQATTAPCVALAPGDFTPYQCLMETQAEITGWQGPGCHPLTVGFPSAIGCQGDTDCVEGMEKCVDGTCHSLSDTLPVPSDCDPGNPTCSPGRECVEGACLQACVGNADCAANQICNNGVCVNPLYGTPPYSIPFAEQLVWQVSHTQKPQHAVSTYALSDIEVSAFLEAGLWMGIEVKMFKKTYHFDLFKISDAWPLFDPINKSWYQAGLEARYQNDCDPASGSTVTNWQPGQPGEERVLRYPNPLPTNPPQFGNAGTEADLLQWCSGELPNHVEDPDAPSEDNLATSVTDMANWGEQIGVDVWRLGGLCVSMKTPRGSTSQPFTDWVKQMDASPTSLMCSYTYNNHTYTFPCGDLHKQQLLIWGCLDVTANPFAGVLAGAFPQYVTTFENRQVLNLDLMLIDPTEEFTLDNLQPQIRNYASGFGVFWYSEVSQCWDARYAQVQPGDVQVLGVSMGLCCGNGILDTSGCGPSNPGNGTQCEQCDDANNLPGDGCSPLCRREVQTPPLGCGDGIVQIGLGEQCDDGNNVPGDGCEPDCTRTPVGCTLTCSASASPSSGHAPLTVVFTASVKGCSGPYTYSWNFGDGATSSEANPSHTYTTAGTYTWTLTVTADGVTCSKTGTISVTCTYGPFPVDTHFRYRAGSVNLNFTASGQSSCGPPPISVSDAWVTATLVKYANNKGKVKVTVTQNPSATPRRATIHLGQLAGPHNLSVTQDGSPCKVTAVSPTKLTVPASGGEQSITVTATQGACNWTASPNGAARLWITMTGGSGAGPGTAVFLVSPNTTGKKRTGTISVAASAGKKTVTVTQNP